MVLLKVCRLRDPENIRQVVSLNPSMMGFDFCRSRSSYMGETDQAILHDIPYNIRKVGLFENQNVIEIASIAGRFMLNSVQIDGDFEPRECEMLSAEGLEVIKSFYIAHPDNFFRTANYEGVCHRFIFKLSTTLDFSVLDHYTGSTPFMLAMKMDNIDIPIITHPMFCGFDTANSCEQAPAFKNMEALNQLIQKIRQCTKNF